MVMAYDVGTIEATLRANLDDTDFKRFDAAVREAKRRTDELRESQARAAREMRTSGATYGEIAGKLGTSEQAVKGLISGTDGLGRSFKETSLRGELYADVLDRQKQNLSGLVTWTKRAALGLAGMGVAGVTYGLKLNAQWETNEMSFATLLGSMEKGKKLMEDLREVSNKSYLRLTDFQEASKIMLGMGVNAKDLVPIMSSVNAAVSAVGGNRETLDRVTLALGQIEAKGKGSAEELRQLAEAGLPIGEILQKELGLSAEQVANIGREGVKSEDILRVVSESWQRKYGPGLERSMKSGNAQFQLLIKNGEGFLRLATEGLYNKVARNVLPELNDELGKMSKVLADPKLTNEQKFRKLEKSFDRLTDKAIKVAEDGIPKIFDALEEMAPKIANRMGRLGVRMAGAMVNAFLNSDALGKLLIGGWLIKMIGGWGAIARAGGRVGGRLAKALGARFLAVIAPYFAADVAADGLGAAVSSRIPGLRKASRGWGTSLGTAFGRAFLAAAITFGLSKIKDALNEQAGGAQDNWDKVGGPPISPAQEKARSWAGSAWNWVQGFSPFGGGKHGGLVTLGGILSMKTGGRVPGVHPDDTVPAMLEPGEFVIQKRAVDQLGVPFLRDLNRGGDVQQEAEDGKDEIVDTYDEIEKKLDKSTEKTEKTVLDRFKSIRKGTTRDQKRVETSMRDSWRKIDRDHSKRVRSMDKETSKRMGSMRGTVVDRGRQMTGSMRDTMGSLESAVMSGFGAIASQTNKALSAFGVEPVKFGTKVGSDKKHAGGGFIAGAGKQDTVPLVLGMAAPGEAILNGAQQAEVEQSLAMTRAMGLSSYGSLDELFANVTTPHYAYAKGGRLQWPTQSRAVTSGFGARSSPTAGASSNHDGIDIGVPDGTPIHAAGPGRVTVSGPNGGYGNYVAIAHPGGILSFYAHLMRSMVRPGQRVQAGQQIALSDNTGTSTGPHLHFGTHMNGVPVDPMQLLSGGGAFSGPVSVEMVKQILLTGPEGALKSLGQGALDKVRKAANKHIRKESSHTSFVDGGAASQGQVMRWLSAALRITGNFTEANLHALYGRAMQESGGDPRAINLWDTNAKAGTPSKGLLQTIDPTFNAYKLPGYGNIWNPVHNAVAAVRYMMARYGHIVGPSSTGYASGGFIDGKKGVLKGRVSWFNDAVTASGVSMASHEGLALNLNPGTDSGWNNPKTQRWMSAGRAGKPYYADVGINGKTGVFPMLDLGPAGSTGRAIDVSVPAIRKMGFSTSSFPTDATGVAWLLGQSKTPRKGSPSYRGPGKGSKGQEDRKKKEQERKRREAAKRRRERMWKRRRRALRGKRRETAAEFELPRFRRDLRPRLSGGELRETERWHDPIREETGAYGIAWNALDRIDPNLRKVRNRLVGSFAMGADFDGMTLRERYAWRDKEDREAREEVAEMRKRMVKQRERDLKRGKVGWRMSGGVGPGNNPGGVFDPSAKKTRKMGGKQIRKLYEQEIQRRAKRIRQQTAARKRQIMLPVHRERSRLRTRFGNLSERGEQLAEIVRDSGRTIRQTRTVQQSQGRAFQFARGGRIGNVAVGGGSDAPVVLNVEITDPTLAALDPRIDVRINKTGRKLAARGRAAGGRKARL